MRIYFPQWARTTGLVQSVTRSITIPQGWLAAALPLVGQSSYTNVSKHWRATLAAYPQQSRLPKPVGSGTGTMGGTRPINVQEVGNRDSSSAFETPWLTLKHATGNPRARFPFSAWPTLHHDICRAGFDLSTRSNLGFFRVTLLPPSPPDRALKKR